MVLHSLYVQLRLINLISSVVENLTQSQTFSPIWSGLDLIILEPNKVQTGKNKVSKSKEK